MRLVDADSAPVYVNEQGCKMMERMPTIDAVPVVRCKACGHSFWLTDERGRRMLCCTEIGKRGLSEESFCSFGKASAV